MAVIGTPSIFCACCIMGCHFFQFWKRKNCALLTRWQLYYPEGLTISGQNSLDRLHPEISDRVTTNKPKERYQALQRDEWHRIFRRFRNDALVIMGIICLQLPFELAYAYLYEAIGIDTLSYKKYKTFWRRKCQTEACVEKPVQPGSRVEKEYMKPSYSASIGAEVEDGLFDDSLKLVLQFGLVMLFACAFPLAFCFAVLYNIAKIRIDALKLLTLLQRPIPRAAPTMGAWLNIFQFLIVISICTNCGLLVCIYDEEREWKIEPGLAAILAMEHVLLLLKFGFSHFVPEEPAWVKAKRFKHVQAQDMCSKDLLKKICSRGKKED